MQTISASALHFKNKVEKSKKSLFYNNKNKFSTY